MSPSRPLFRLALLTAAWAAATPARAQMTREPYLQLGTSSAVTVVWRTLLDADSHLCYGAAPDSLTQSASVSGRRTQHEVPITGLSPGQRVYYAVTSDACPPGSAGDPEDYYDPAPTPGTDAPLRLWVVGDSGTGGRDQRAVRDAMLSATSSARPDLFLHVGDMAYNSGTRGEFDRNFFSVYRDILRHTVVWPAMGNHEGRSSDSGDEDGPYYEAYVLPRAGEAGGMASGTEAYYAFDQANVHFVVLDSHDSPRQPDGAMLRWLEQDLAATDQTWIIAFWHHPPYTKGSHDSDSEGQLIEMRENALPILEAAGVDLVLTGHSHIYERSFLIHGAYATPTTAAGHVVDPGDGRPGGDGAYQKTGMGAVYVTAGHGGTGVGGSGGHPVMFYDELENGSCLIDVDGDVLRLTNLTRDGAETDWFTLTKGEATDIPETVNETPIPFGSVWEYYDQGDPGDGWKTGSGGWPEGPAQLGYGDDDEATVLEDVDPNRPSAYFRRRFELPAEVTLKQAVMQIVYDDGAAVFVNGEPLWALNTDADPSHLAYASDQSSDNELAMRRVDLAGDHPFVAGENSIAVMVKQANLRSSDLSFDFELRVTYELPDDDGGGGDPDAGGPGGGDGGSGGDGTADSGAGGADDGGGNGPAGGNGGDGANGGDTAGGAANGGGPTAGSEGGGSDDEPGTKNSGGCNGCSAHPAGGTGWSAVLWLLSALPLVLRRRS